MVRGMSSLGEIPALAGGGSAAGAASWENLGAHFPQPGYYSAPERKRDARAGWAAAPARGIHFDFWHRGAGMNLKQAGSRIWLVVLATVFGVIAGVSPACAFLKLEDP